MSRSSRLRRLALLPVVAALALLGPAAGALAAPAPARAAGPAAATTARLPGPLHTYSRWIVNTMGVRVKLSGANWSGAETQAFVVGGLDVQGLDTLAGRIAEAGFNAVRLPWSNELVERNPVVARKYLTANPQLQGQRALGIFDAVVAALGRHGVMVVLDNHRSRADWCCDEQHGDGLWYTPEYPEFAWIADWQTMARRYRDTKNVVAAELRNEIRPEPDLAPGPTVPTWGDGKAKTDWRLAAQRGGNAVLAVNPRLLIIVGGLNYNIDLSAVGAAPVRLSVQHRVVYAAHDYAWDYSADQLQDYAQYAASATARWGYLTQGKNAAPVYVSEFGTCTNPNATEQCGENDPAYIRDVSTYLGKLDLDYAYWPFNGTQGTGYNRTYGAPETYGLLDPSWTHYGDLDVLHALQSLEAPKHGPGVDLPPAPRVPLG